MSAPRVPRGSVAVALIAAVAVLLCLVALRAGNSDAPPQPTSRSASPDERGPEATPGQHDDTVDVALRDGLSRIASTPLYVDPSTAPRIGAPANEQADLYASEFVRRLLTRDYVKTSRDSHLAWVQTESAATTEPLVIGLIPESARSRFAVWSVSDTTEGPATVPAEGNWAQLASEAAVDVAQVERVSQPVVWTNAVASGRITDPGITAREVSVTVTRTSAAGTQRFSVAVGLNLEGPPVRPAYGVVGVITFTSIPVGPA